MTNLDALRQFDLEFGYGIFRYVFNPIDRELEQSRDEILASDPLSQLLVCLARLQITHFQSADLPVQPSKAPSDGRSLGRRRRS